MIAIVDTGGANLASLENAFLRLGRQAKVTSSEDEIKSASHVILPGVGAAADAMQRIREKNLTACIPKLTNPVLGICLGMQLLCERSDEGETECLGILPGTVKRFPSLPGLSVPHIGWNQVRQVGKSLLLGDIADRTHFYFVHSFVAPDGEWVSGKFDHGDAYPALVQRDNFFGTQFHPERSSTWGNRLLENFLRL